MNFTLKCIHLTEDSEETYTFSIYRDDTIDNVKSKLMPFVKYKNVDEYYFFTKQWVRLNPYDQYKKLSFDNSRTIPYEMFAAFCLNHDLPLPVKKDAYELDDFLELPEEVHESIPVGIVHGTPFVVNPLKNLFNQQEDSGTSSKSLWMNLPDTIYVCFAREVYDYSQTMGLEISKVFNTYYPYLFKEDRMDPSLFDNQEKTDYLEYNRIIDFHHKVYNPKYILSEGIISLYFVLYTLESFSFPLDIFFKLYQSSKQNPFIKLNGQKTHENIYRLYCNQQNESGYKIPALKKKTILKYAHDINKNSISYLFYSKDIPIFLNVNKKGHLYVRLEQIPFLPIETIELMVKETVQSFIGKLFEYFDPSQKIFTPFEGFHQSNLSILDMKYKCNYKKEGKMNVQKYMTCFSPVFNFMNEKEKIHLRYKRVSNYNESQSKDAYLIEAFNKAVPIEEMILLFSANFMKHDDKAAADYVHQFFSTIEIEEKQNNLRRVKINPGFLVEIDKKENIEVTVHSIDHIQYLPFIRLYITNLILLSQGILSDEGMCKKIKEIVVKEIAPIKPVVEETNFRMNDDFEIMEDPDSDDESESIKPNDPDANRSSNSLSLPNAPNVNPSNNSLSLPSEANANKSRNSLSLPSEANANRSSNSLSLPSEEPSEEPGEPNANKSNSLSLPFEEPSEEPNEPNANRSSNSLSLPSEEPSEEPGEPNANPSNSLSLPNANPSNNSLSLPNANQSNNSLSPPKKGGATISDAKMYDVFIYDENDPYTIQKKFKKDPLREGKITDYFRVFQGEECSLVKKENESCKGYVVELEGSQLKELAQDATLLFIDYFDKPGNAYSGVTYSREPKDWTDHPSIQFIKKVYATLSYGWKHKLDHQDEMHIYDNENTLKARYNGKYYVKLDEDEELTKIQFTPVNPLLQRLQEREPLLFTKTDKNHTQYSRMCLWSDKRQPVILSKEEKERIDEIAPGSYESAIEYSTDPKKPYFYICPRYWDLKHNLPVHPDKVDPDKLISRNASDSEKQKNIQSRYILELAKPGDKPVYQTRPGFLTKKHPKGYYMPCCFISKPKKDKPDAIDKRIQEASQFFDRAKEKEDPNEKVKDYIQNGDKFPLTDNRKGHLTPILEKFFQLNYSDCYSQIQKRKLKLNYPCLLRQGVQESQSFLSSLSFLYFKKSVPLDQFMKVLLEKITIDTIQTFHNGGLVDTFAKDYESQDIQAYTQTRLYQTLKNPTSFQKVVNGYENFIKYLNSKDYIDYTYLWDIVTQVLFKEKVNMVIFKEGLEDVTHNLHIVCPTTAHALYRFRESFPSILIYQKGNLFEPLFIYKKIADGKDKTITLFDLSDHIPSVHAILQKIYENIGDSCKERTIHKSYTFKENIYLHELVEELKSIDYVVEKQVMNIDGRIFGLLVRKDKTKPFFVPCTPSAVNGDYAIEFIDDVNWSNYRDTVQHLKRLYETSQQKIPCKPKIRILENQLIVGILTETNQFVPLKEPEENKVKDELIVLDETNPRLVNDTIQSGVMQPKEKVIQHLKLEQMFYNAFFNTLKVELNDNKNILLRKQIEKAIQTKDKLKLDNLFGPILEEKFLFVEDYAVDLYDIQHVNLCKNRDEPYCGTLEHEGKLLIPLYNLFNQSNNEESYVHRFIDDLMMNVHVQRILLEEIHSTVYYTDRYQLSDHEILLLESDLNTYLDKEPVKKIESVVHSMLEDVQPSKWVEFAEKIEPVEWNEPNVMKDEMDIPDEDISEQDEIAILDPEDVFEPIQEPLTEPVSEPVPEPVPEPITGPKKEINLDLDMGLDLNAPEPEPEIKSISLNSLPVKVKTRPEPKTRKVKPIATAEPSEPLDNTLPKTRPKPVRSRKMKPIAAAEPSEPLDNTLPKTRPKPVRSRKMKPIAAAEPGETLDNTLPKTRPKPVRSRKMKPIAAAEPNEPVKKPVLGTSLDTVAVAPKKFEPVLNTLVEPTEQEIETLSWKIKQNEEQRNVDKAEEYVRTAKEYHQTSKTKATEEVLLLAQEQLHAIQPVLLTKIKRIETDLIPCIKTFYFKANSKWKDYFPPKTIGFRIMKGDTYETSVVDVTCNFIMALQILKSYDKKYSAITIRDLKEMLIKSYTHLSETLLDLNKKFRKEKKRFTSWSDIQTESYPFTQLDLIVLMIEYKLPVVIFIQAKNKIKLLTYHTEDTFKYYIKMKKKDVFMFFIANHDFRIERRDMGALYHAERDIVYLNDPGSLAEFIQHY